MSKRPRPSYQVDESSSSGGGTDNFRVGDSNYDPQPSPKKKANVQSTIRTSQKVKLRGLDGFRCLITGETDGHCIEVCHILRRKEADDDLDRYQKYFGMKEPIFVDSVKNLIHLRADWHESFGAGCWALVPTMADLEDIIRRLESEKKWQFPHLDVEKRDYQFISFPSLGEKPIHRVTETESGYERIPYEAMPLLRSHIHPYFVIANAIPKFRSALVMPPLRRLSAKLARINDLWQTLTAGQIASGSGISHLGGGGSGQGGGGGGVGRGGSRSGNRGKRGGGVGGGDDKCGGGQDASSKRNDGGKDNCGGKTGDERGWRASDKMGYYSGDCDPGASDGEFPDDQRQTVVDWREQVMKVGTPKPAGVHWKVRKRAHRQYREDWGDWYPSFNPADRSTFTSNDWAMYWKSFNLPRRPPEL